MTQPQYQDSIGADDLRRLARPSKHLKRPRIMPATPIRSVVTAEDVQNMARPQPLSVTPAKTSQPTARQYNDQHATEIGEMNRTTFFTKLSDIVTRIRSNLDNGWTCILLRDEYADGQQCIYFTNLNTRESICSDPRGVPVEDPPPYESTLDLWYCHFVPKADYSDARFACTHDGHLFFGFPCLRKTQWWWNLASQGGTPLFSKQPTAYSIADLETIREYGNMEGPARQGLMKLKELGLWQEVFGGTESQHARSENEFRSWSETWQKEDGARAGLHARVVTLVKGRNHQDFDRTCKALQDGLLLNNQA